MTVVERRTWRDQRAAGVVHTAIGVGGAWLVGVGLRRAIGPTGATALATAVAVAGRMLDTEAMAVADLLAASDLAAARRRVQALVGRDPSGLDAAGIARAVVESVAENTTDAVVAPAVWAAVGGAPAVLAHRAVNTLDAMVGHRSPRYAALRVVGRPPRRPRQRRPRRRRRAARRRAAPVALAGRGARRRRGRRPPPVAERRPHRSRVRRLARRDARWRQPLRRRGRGSRSARRRPRPGPADIARAVQLRRWVGLALAVGLIAVDVTARRAGGRGGGPTTGWRRAAS